MVVWLMVRDLLVRVEVYRCVLLIVVWCCLRQNLCCDEIGTSLVFRLVVDVIVGEAAKRSSVYSDNRERSNSVTGGPG
jgi:hypothetical protein